MEKNPYIEAHAQAAQKPRPCTARSSSEAMWAELVKLRADLEELQDAVALAHAGGVDLERVPEALRPKDQPT